MQEKTPNVGGDQEKKKEWPETGKQGGQGSQGDVGKKGGDLGGDGGKKREGTDLDEGKRP